MEKYLVMGLVVVNIMWPDWGEEVSKVFALDCTDLRPPSVGFPTGSASCKATRSEPTHLPNESLPSRALLRRVTNLCLKR